MSWQPLGPAILFAPADKPERFAKAYERADMIIIDLEDGCQPVNRETARQQLADASLDPARTIIRVSGAQGPDFAADCAAAAATGIAQIMLAKAESAADVEAVAARIPGAQVIALLETPRGVLAAGEIAASASCAALFWGAEDLVAGLGGNASRRADGRYRDIPRFARAHAHLHAAAHGKAMLDAVYVNIPDLDGLRAEAEDAAALGFAASVCIHPNQVETIRAAYRPSAAAIAWAQGLLAAAESNKGAFAYEGRMVDEPLFKQAQAIIRRAGA